MVRYIIGALLAFVLLALLVIWIVSGGPRALFTSTKASLAHAVPSGEDVGFHLPWQPVQVFPTLDITDAFTVDENDDASPQERLAQLEAEYERLNSEVSAARTFGARSPYAGKVTIVQDTSGMRESDTHDEYIQIAANYANSESIDITGWTLESALSGVRVALPPSAAPFIANSANVLTATALDPGGLALVLSAPSPVGVSLRENICTGYLGQFQDFSPPLSEECPSPSEVLPLTENNLQQYGDACFDAIQNLSGVSSACRAYLTDQLSYNGCINKNRFRSGFQKNMWRVYLGAPSELWRNSHDAIRLLDAQGRTVSVFVY